MTTMSYSKRTTRFAPKYQPVKPKVNWTRVTLTTLAVIVTVLTVATSIKVWSA